MATPKLTPTEMATHLSITPTTTLILTNEPSSTRAKQSDGMEDARTNVTIQTFLRNINMLSPKDGKPIVKFKSSPRRVERWLTPEKCRGRELGILLELETERDVDRLVTTWKKASKKGERRQLIRWPVDKTASATASASMPAKLSEKSADISDSSEDEDDEE